MQYKMGAEKFKIFMLFQIFLTLWIYILKRAGISNFFLSFFSIFPTITKYT